MMRQMWASRVDAQDAVILIAEGGEEIPVHACVLAAASPVFAAALNVGMKETTTRRINVTETPKEVVEGALAILYTGIEPCRLDLDQTLVFAHKYNIVEVAKHVAPKLIKSLSVNNAANVARLLRDFDTSSASQTQFVGTILNM